MPGPANSDHNKVVRKINATLQGPVIEALAELVPEVKGLPRRDALEIILDDPDLLHRCFLAFRADPEHFRHLLIDRRKVAVEDADALLECGRSLEDVVAMVVRTCAKRHFRRRLDGTGKPLRATRIGRRSSRKDLLGRLLALMASTPAPQPRQITRGEMLYEAFKDHLLHDWQVPLIPEYANLTPGMVRRLNTKLLDYRIAEDLRRLRTDPDNPPPPTPVVDDSLAAIAFRRAGAAEEEYEEEDPRIAAAVSTAEMRVSDGMAKLDYGPVQKNTDKDERARLDDILTMDGKRLKSSAFTIVLLDPKVREVLPNSEQTVRITGVLGAVNGMVGKLLVGELGLRLDQLAVFLMAAHGALGDKRFETAFGVPGRPDYVRRIVDRAKTFNIGQQTPIAEIAAFVTKSFAAAEAAAKKKDAG